MTSSSSTVVSAVTPAGRAAISTIAVRGRDAARLVQRHFRRRSRGWNADLPINRIVFGTWSRSLAETREQPGDEHQPIGEEVVVCRRDDTNGAANIEIHCHGGRAAAAAILADLAKGGGDVIAWPDWIAAVAPSATIAEAQLALAHATTLRTAQILLDQYQGALQQEIARIASALDADTRAACAALEALLVTARFGLRLASCWQVAIVGPPNVGKSSLTNAIVGYQRSIVHALPGTTRDILTATTAIDGWPIEFADTAGIRTTDDPIESAGVGLARQTARRADLVVVVFDASQPWSELCAQFLQPAERTNLIVVQNKLDLIAAVPADRPCDVATSAACGDGMAELMECISRMLVPDPPSPGQAVLFTARQQRLVQRALQALRQGQPDIAGATLTMMQSLAEDR